MTQAKIGVETPYKVKFRHTKRLIGALRKWTKQIDGRLVKQIYEDVIQAKVPEIVITSFLKFPPVNRETEVRGLFSGCSQLKQRAS